MILPLLFLCTGILGVASSLTLDKGARLVGIFVSIFVPVIGPVLVTAAALTGIGVRKDGHVNRTEVRYNRAHAKVQVESAKLDSLQKRLIRAQARYDALMEQAGAVREGGEAYSVSDLKTMPAELHLSHCRNLVDEQQDRVERAEAVEARILARVRKDANRAAYRQGKPLPYPPEVTDLKDLERIYEEERKMAGAGKDMVAESAKEIVKEDEKAVESAARIEPPKIIVNVSRRQRGNDVVYYYPESLGEETGSAIAEKAREMDSEASVYPSVQMLHQDNVPAGACFSAGTGFRSIKEFTECLLYDTGSGEFIKADLETKAYVTGLVEAIDSEMKSKCFMSESEEGKDFNFGKACQLRQFGKSTVALMYNGITVAAAVYGPEGRIYGMCMKETPETDVLRMSGVDFSILDGAQDIRQWCRIAGDICLSQDNIRRGRLCVKAWRDRERMEKEREEARKAAEEVREKEPVKKKGRGRKV